MSDIRTQKLAQTLVSQLMQGSQSGPEGASTADSANVLELIKSLQTDLQGVDRGIARADSKLAEAASQVTDPITDHAREEQMNLLDLRKSLIGQINTAKGEIEEAQAEASYDDKVYNLKQVADSNVDAFKESIVDEKIEAKQSILENPGREKALQGAYQAQLEVAKEGVGFWREESGFWGKQQQLGPINNQEELGGLFTEVARLEDQISNTFGTDSKDKDGLKKQLTSVKNEVSALRSRA